MIKVESTKTLLVMVLDIKLDCETELNIFAISPEMAILFVKTELLNTKYPPSNAATTPPSTPKLLLNVQLFQLTTLCCSTYMTPPSNAVLFSNIVFLMTVCVSLVPAYKTDTSSYQFISEKLESIMFNLAPEESSMNESNLASIFSPVKFCNCTGVYRSTNSVVDDSTDILAPLMFLIVLLII